MLADGRQLYDDIAKDPDNFKAHVATLQSNDDREALRNVPLEIKRVQDKDPTYEATFEDLGYTLDQPQL